MTPAEYLIRCADHLREALAAEKVLLPTMLALRDLAAALAPGHAIQFETAAEVSRLLFVVTPRVSDAVAGHLTPEHVFFAMGCANAAMGCMVAPRRFDLIGYFVMLEAEIKAVHLRNLITTGGQIDLAHMLARSPQPAAPFLLDAPTVH